MFTKLNHGHVLSVIFFLLPSIIAFAPIQTSAFLTIASVTVLFSWLMLERRVPPFNRPLLIISFVLILLGALSGFWANDPIATTFTALRLLLLSISGIVLCGIVSTLSIKQRHMIGSASILGMVIGMTLLLTDVLSDGFIQINILGEEYADYGRTVSLLALIIWSFLVQTSVRNQPLLGIGLLIVVAGVLSLTPGFAAKVALLAGVVTLFCAWRFRAPFSKLLFAIIAASFLLAPTLASKLDQPDYYYPLIAAESDLAPMRWTVAIAHRMHMWGFTAKRSMEKPIFGWGLDMSRRIPGGTEKIRPEDLGFTRTQLHGNAVNWLSRGNATHLSLHPHNAILQIWLELGLAGVLLACSFIFYITNVANRHCHPAGLALCLATLIIANVSYGAWQSWWLSSLWLISALYLVGIVPDEAGMNSNDQTVS